MNKEFLKTLQLIDTGFINEMPPDMLIWDGNYICGKQKVTEFNTKFSTCLICGITEPLIWHHVYTKNTQGKSSTSGKTTISDFLSCLGLVHICPNCHYYIHQLNPFNGKTRLH
jgi:hypothetical protein